MSTASRCRETPVSDYHKERLLLEQERGSETLKKNAREALVEGWKKENRVFVTYHSNEIYHLAGVIVQCGDVYYEEPSEIFPSDWLVASLALATAVGGDSGKPRLLSHDNFHEPTIKHPEYKRGLGDLSP